MTTPERDQPPQAAGDDVLLSPNEEARARGDEPRFVKYGRSVKYPLSYLLEDMRARTSSSTSPVSSAATK